MKDWCTNSKYLRDKWSISTSLLCDSIFEVSFCRITVTSTGNIWLIDTGLEFTWSLSITTLNTSICGRIPFLRRYTTCSWFSITQIIITTYCLSATNDTTFVFVIDTTIDTVTTLTTLFPTTDTIIVTNCCVTCLTSCETFFLCCTVELSFSTGCWNTSIFY